MGLTKTPHEQAINQLDRLTELAKTRIKPLWT